MKAGWCSRAPNYTTSPQRRRFAQPSFAADLAAWRLLTLKDKIFAPEEGINVTPSSRVRWEKAAIRFGI